MIVDNTVQTAAKGAAPQKVFDTKKTLLRFDQTIWYISGLIQVVLGFRFILKLLGASQSSGFTRFIYSISGPLADPFRGIFGISSSGNSYLEWSTLMAIVVYLAITWGLIRLLELFFPITPNDVETE